MNAIAFSPTGDLLATGGDRICTFSRVGRLLTTSARLDEPAVSLAFSPTGRELTWAAGRAVYRMGLSMRDDAETPLLEGETVRLHRGSLCELDDEDDEEAEGRDERGLGSGTTLCHIISFDRTRGQWQVRSARDGSDRYVSESSLRLCYSLLPSHAKRVRTYAKITLEVHGACGRGVAAAEDIRAGAPIFEEAPFLIARESRGSPAATLAWRWRACKTLRSQASAQTGDEIWSQALSAFLELQASPGTASDAPEGVREVARQIAASEVASEVEGAGGAAPEEDLVQRITDSLMRFATNQHSWHSGALHGGTPATATALYPMISRANHSCAPNMLLSLKEDTFRLHGRPFDVAKEGGVLVFTALRDIKMSEPLTYTYSQLALADGDGGCRSVSERRDILRRQNGFTCECERCVAEAALASPETPGDDTETHVSSGGGEADRENAGETPGSM